MKADIVADFTWQVLAGWNWPSQYCRSDIGNMSAFCLVQPGFKVSPLSPLLPFILYISDLCALYLTNMEHMLYFVFSLRTNLCFFGHEIVDNDLRCNWFVSFPVVSV